MNRWVIVGSNSEGVVVVVVVGVVVSSSKSRSSEIIRRVWPEKIGLLTRSESRRGGASEFQWESR